MKVGEHIRRTHQMQTDAHIYRQIETGVQMHLNTSEHITDRQQTDNRQTTDRQTVDSRQ